MKTLVTFLILAFAGTLCFSQTKLIAFKSHSGNLHYFDASGPDMLGLPSFHIDTIIKLDSSIVEIGGRGYNWGRQVDTINHHPYCILPEYTLKELKSSYGYNITYLGFDKKKDAAAKEETPEVDEANPSLKDTQVDTSKEEKGIDVMPIKDPKGLEQEQHKEQIKSKNNRSTMLPIFLVIVACGSMVFGIYFWNRGKKHIIIE